SSRRTKATWQGCKVSAVTSYGLPDMVAMSPRISPGLAILRISVFPPLELIESFTCPSQSTNTPRGSCFSRNRTAPAGYVADDFVLLKSAKAVGLSWQKKLFPRTLQDWQCSGSSKP